MKGIEMKKQPVPSPGQQLVASVLAQMAEDDLVPDARDLALLDTSAQLADRMADLQALIAADGKRSISETGIVRLHPGIAEYRQHSIALAKVLAAVALVETNGASRKDPAKVRAAETRWRAHNVAKVQGTA
ncbi:MAG: hypothetical protein ABI662_09495 [Dermatophilaceae bacterium]